MDRPESTSSSVNSTVIMERLRLSLASKNLTVPQQIQALRDLMASDLGVDAMFHHCCQDLIMELRQTLTDLPTIPLPNARAFLSDQKVLSRLKTNPLHIVAGDRIDFRVHCIEELGRLRRTDLLLKQIGHLNHWKEGQAMIKAISYVATSDQIFQVLLQFIRSQFSNKGWYHFGPDVYREESIDALFSAAVPRVDLKMAHQLHAEFRKGATLMGLFPEQFARYDSMITAVFVALQIRNDLSTVVNVSAFPVAHPDSGVFEAPQLLPDIARHDVDSFPPTRVNAYRPVDFRPGSGQPTVASTASAAPPLPSISTRSPYPEGGGESSGFLIGEDDGSGW